MKIFIKNLRLDRVELERKTASSASICLSKLVVCFRDCDMFYLVYKIRNKQKRSYFFISNNYYWYSMATFLCFSFLKYFRPQAF